MKQYDNNGTINYIGASADGSVDKDKLMIVDECYCPSGHNLVSKHAVFNTFPGFVLRLKNETQDGIVALSPIYGDKSRISLDIDLHDNEKYQIHCPQCDVPLPTFARCTCGGELVTIFLDKSYDLTNCLCVCNRVGCHNAEVQAGSMHLTYTKIEHL